MPTVQEEQRRIVVADLLKGTLLHFMAHGQSVPRFPRCSQIATAPHPPLCGFGGHFVSPSRGPPFAEFHFLNFTNAEYIQVP